MKVVGTAGHIDHGKSALVKRLTGIDPDRLEEEKRRGMTIELGFAWLPLPNGEVVSIVDVPGHERFVANMLAGAGGIDVALLVVAADEAVMPQTREHVDILDLLGVRSGVVALTKCDLVDDDLLELAAAEVAELLSSTSLAESPIVPVSSVTGAGTDALLGALSTAVAAAPGRDDLGLPYLPIDRVFTVSGFGTVVTGTLHDGALAVGDEVEIMPAGRTARIRSLQTHSAPVKEALPGSRVAANLGGIERRDVRRGDVLARPGRIRPTRRFDASLRVVDSAPFALRHGQDVALHLGAGEYRATVSVLVGDSLEPGETGWVQIRSRAPLPAVRSQRFILRLPSPARTIAGGEVVDIRPRHRRGDTRALQRLEALVSGDVEQAVGATLLSAAGLTVAQIVAMTGFTQIEVQTAVDRLLRHGSVIHVGSLYIGRPAWDVLAARASVALQRFHAENPLQRGMTREELRSKLHRSREEWPAWLHTLIEQGIVQADGASVWLPGFENEVGHREEEIERVLAALSLHPFAPPTGRELEAQARTDDNMLAFMVQSGKIVHVGGGVYFESGAFDQLVALALEIIDREGAASMAAFRDAAGTSRKYAQAFLEYLDARRITRRQGDLRVRGREAPACA